MTPPGTKVLIVEDDSDFRRMYRTAIALAGFDVEEAVDGIDALRRLDHARPDVIVLKIALPDISGVALAQELASHVHTRDIPLVVIGGPATDLGSIRPATLLSTPPTPEQLVVAVRRALSGAVS